MKRRIFALSLMLLLLLMAGGEVAAQTSDAFWFVRYWNNPDQTGDSAHSTTVGTINYNWREGSPHNSIGNDSWSGRWTSNIDFTPGTYRFTTVSDDGVRLYVGDKHIILDWNKHPVRTNVATVSLAGGNYPVALDYFEDRGQAQLRLYWEYLGPPAANSEYVRIISSGTAANPPSGNWSASYWNNSGLQGSPAVNRNETEINYNWGAGSPASGIGNDNWSARWNANIQFPTAGTYRFVATMDDGMRVWVDGSLIVDAWYDSPPHTIRADRFMSAGTHPIRVEYYDRSGGAVAQLSWYLVPTPAPPPPVYTRWLGEYYNNASLSGAPVLVRDDAEINFNWGTGSPSWGTVPSDNFSVRWSRSLDLTPGRYRFTISHDDGVRLWAGDVLLVDRWYVQTAATRQAEIDWPGGVIPIKMEYFENTGLAQANLSWTRLGTGTSTSGEPKATVNSAFLNFRSGPGTNSSIIAAYPRNTVVTLMGRNIAGNWLYVMAPNGQFGWMFTSFLATSYPVNTLPVVAG